MKFIPKRVVALHSGRSTYSIALTMLAISSFVLQRPVYSCDSSVRLFVHTQQIDDLASRCHVVYDAHKCTDKLGCT